MTEKLEYDKSVGMFRYKTTPEDIKKVMAQYNAQFAKSNILNGNTIVNTENYTNGNSKIQYVFLNNDLNKIALFFDDPERPKIGAKVFLTYSNVGGIEKLHWELKVMGYQPILPGEPTPQLDFRVPTNCELIKQ